MLKILIVPCLGPGGGHLYLFDRDVGGSSVNNI